MYFSILQVQWYFGNSIVQTSQRLKINVEQQANTNNYTLTLQLVVSYKVYLHCRSVGYEHIYTTTHSRLGCAVTEEQKDAFVSL